MTPNERERFYDSEIAPRLIELAKACEAHEVSLVCVANWGTEDHSRTVNLQAGAPFSIRLVEVAARVNGNVDALYIALAKHGREHGHNSVVLSRLTDAGPADGVR